MNGKKGFSGILLFLMVVFILMILAFMISMAVGIIDFTSDEITPIMEGLGMVGDVNMSQASQYSVGVVDGFVQALPWLTGLLFVMALVFSVIFAVSISAEASPVFIGVYLAFIILLIFGGVVLSNMYQDIYTGDDEIATRLHEQTITSFMILHAPWVIAIITLLTGIYLFTRSPTVIGGYGI